VIGIVLLSNDHRPLVKGNLLPVSGLGRCNLWFCKVLATALGTGMRAVSTLLQWKRGVGAVGNPSTNPSGRGKGERPANVVGSREQTHQTPRLDQSMTQPLEAKAKQGGGPAKESRWKGKQECRWGGGDFSYFETSPHIPGLLHLVCGHVVPPSCNTGWATVPSLLRRSAENFGKFLEIRTWLLVPSDNGKGLKNSP
jgi:hypothetical protein